VALGEPEADAVVPGQFRDDLPTVSLAELRRHDGKGADKSVWVNFGRGIYDVTEFAASHPGGSKILLGAGKSIAPFWDLYAVHRTGWVYELLEGMRVANLDEEGVEILERCSSNKGEGAFASEPDRHPALDVRSPRPFNAETPPALLGDAFRTPAALFYVRNHLPVPVIEEEEHVLTVEGAGVARPLRLTVSDLRTRFRQVEVEAVLQCGGNRRREMARVRKVHGLDWDRAAIGNAVWRGPLLRDVLRAAGLPGDEADPIAAAGGDGGPGSGAAVPAGSLHVQMEGSDTDESGDPYGASIPAWRALSREQDVVLALDMNGQPLSRDHGFPVRAVVPGVVASRSVKWLRRVVVSDEESRSFWQRKDYKALGPATDWAAPDVEAAPSVYETAVQAAVLSPLPECGDDAVDVPADEDAEVTVSGYAWSGGGRGVLRVDVSADGGETWQEADLRDDSGQREGRHWAWTLWEAEVPPPGPGQRREVVVRAVDTSLNVQPERGGPQWSARGLFSNAWSRVVLRRAAEPAADGAAGMDSAEAAAGMDSAEAAAGMDSAEAAAGDSGAEPGR